MSATATIKRMEVYRVEEDEDLHFDVTYTEMAAPDVPVSGTAATSETDPEEVLNQLGIACGTQFIA